MTHINIIRRKVATSLVTKAIKIERDALDYERKNNFRIGHLYEQYVKTGDTDFLKVSKRCAAQSVKHSTRNRLYETLLVKIGVYLYPAKADKKDWLKIIGIDSDLSGQTIYWVQSYIEKKYKRGWHK